MRRLNRSLALKLTLAFVLVGILGVATFALLVGQRSRTEFRRFLSERDRAGLVVTLAQAYADQGSWDAVVEALRAGDQLMLATHGAVVTDAGGRVVLGNDEFAPGDRLPRGELARSLPLEVGGATVGYLHFRDDAGPPYGAMRGMPMSPRSMPMTHMTPMTVMPGEADLFDRVLWAAATSAALTVVVALVVGGLLARTLTQPLRALTAATQAMAHGELDQQVQVQTHDEIGELGMSFNRMSRDLARASSLRKQMTADLAHDLRTPLSIVHGYMEGLKEGRLQGSPALYTILYEEVEHLERLVDDLRLLSLADAGELTLQRRAVDPAALLERTGLAYMGAAAARGVVLRVETQADLPSSYVDTDRMTQVLNNLVSNALRHTQQGEIVLAAQVVQEQAGAWVELRVQDSGAGIAPEDLPLIFDRFYRADKSRQRTEATGDGATVSSGLGLAIAKAIVEAHGGRIGVTSVVGVGTTFALRLPALPPGQAEV
jgi:two-component system sensor histidine kinase BaeS